MSTPAPAQPGDDRVRRLTRRRDRGAVGLIVAAMVGPLLLVGGLVWDAAGKISTVQAAQNSAQEAARAAAQALSGSAITGTGAAVDPGQAVAAGQAFLAADGTTGSVTLTPTTITVTTSRPWTPRFLPGGGTVSGHATVRLATAP